MGKVVNIYLFRFSLKLLLVTAILFTAAFDVMAEEEPGGGTAGPAFVIHQPQGNSSVSREANHLVARVADERILYVAAAVNGNITPVIDVSQEEYKNMFADFVIVRIYLLPGKNEIELTGKDAEGNEVAREKVEVHYREPFSNDTSAVPQPFEIRPFHTESGEKACAGCHRMQVDTLVDMDPVKKFDIFCVRCHEASIAEWKGHGGATWKCLYCHNAEGEAKYGVADKDGIFCEECHSAEIASFLNMTSVHPLFKGRRCLSCHGGHVAEAGLLYSPVNQLCYGCHKPVFDGSHITPGHPLKSAIDPSREGKPLDCVSCHNPHGADKKSLLRFPGGGMVMCQECHKK